MPVLDLTLPTAAENLALDEALLEAAENGELSFALRFWESPLHFVALGYTNRAAVEANLPACAEAGIPVLRRCSGGGTVLQGPGCLNYAVIAPVEAGQELNVGATNCFVMRRTRLAMQDLLGEPVEIAGHTDLAAGGLKFSGNAQKRKKRHFLFHGTLLHHFDLDLVQRVLLPPSKEPDYRGGRSHREFIRNLELAPEAIKAALAKGWETDGSMELTQALTARTRALVEERYSQDVWNFRF